MIALSHEHLNAAQRKGVTDVEGPHLINAGPGAGKTRVLTYRIAYLLEKKYATSNQILALTFTNKAAKEMKNRIADLIGAAASKLWIGTFHAVCARILRMEHDLLELPQAFSIYDAQDSLQAIKIILRELQLSEEVYPSKWVRQRISSAKNQRIDAYMYRSNPDFQQADRALGREQMGKIYVAYDKSLKQAHALDFDDLLLKVTQLWGRYPESLKKWQERFRYVLVDEFQDTNQVQYHLLKQLVRLHKNLCVIGDDAQSIYAFRGAKIEHILSFKKDFPTASITRLEQNYRSQPHIVAVANALIKHNTQQLQKNIFTKEPAKDLVVVKQNTNEIEEAEFVVESILDAQYRQQLGFDAYAILYRTHAQSRSFEEKLRKKGIPYKLLGGMSFYARKEIKDIIAYLRLLVNPNDLQALERVINLPKRGIGAATLQKIKAYSGQYAGSLWEALEAVQQQVAPKVRNGLQHFMQLIETYRKELNQEPLHRLAEKLAEASGLLTAWKADKTPEGVSRYDNMQELFASIKQFEEDNPTKQLSDYLQEITLLYATEKTEDAGPRVTLATVHAVKGLEYGHVFVVGLEQGLFPSMGSLGNPEEIEEERRLLYVAVTRAKQKLYLTYARSRYRYGRQVALQPSVFLSELPKEHVTYQLPKQFLTPDTSWKKKMPRGFKRKEKHAMPSAMGQSKRSNALISLKERLASGIANREAPDSPVFKVGMQVRHHRFGLGTIQQLEGAGKKQRGTVDFLNAGQKTILLAFSKLIIEHEE